MDNLHVLLARWQVPRGVPFLMLRVLVIARRLLVLLREVPVGPTRDRLVVSDMLASMCLMEDAITNAIHLIPLLLLP